MLSQKARIARLAGQSLCRSALAVAVAFFAATAQASPILQVDITPSGGQSTGNTGATGRLTFEFFDGAQDTFTLLIENTTPLALASKFTGVAIEIPDNLPNLPVFATGGTSSYFDELTYNYQATPGFLNAVGGYDLAITSEGNFLGGPPQGAPSSGQSQLVTISLGNTPLNADQLLADFQALYSDANTVLGRFQAVGPNGGSDRVTGHLTPEPSTLLLLALGQCFLMRLRRHTK